MSEKHTQGRLKQGCLLDTPTTRRWTQAEREQADAHERRTLFFGFTSADEGRSRVRVALCDREEDARRLVACWNRLQDFTTEQIEDFGYDLFAEVRPHYEQAIRQRDELLAALEEVLAAERFSNRPPETVMQAEAKLDRIRKAAARAEAAIAKVKGGAA